MVPDETFLAVAIIGFETIPLVPEKLFVFFIFLAAGCLEPTTELLEASLGFVSLESLINSSSSSLNLEVGACPMTIGICDCCCCEYIIVGICCWSVVCGGKWSIGPCVDICLVITLIGLILVSIGLICGWIVVVVSSEWVFGSIIGCEPAVTTVTTDDLELFDNKRTDPEDVAIIIDDSN